MSLTALRPSHGQRSRLLISGHTGKLTGLLRGNVVPEVRNGNSVRRLLRPRNGFLALDGDNEMILRCWTHSAGRALAPSISGACHPSSSSAMLLPAASLGFSLFPTSKRALPSFSFGSVTVSAVSVTSPWRVDKLRLRRRWRMYHHKSPIPANATTVAPTPIPAAAPVEKPPACSLPPVVDVVLAVCDDGGNVGVDVGAGVMVEFAAVVAGARVQPSRRSAVSGADGGWNFVRSLSAQATEMGRAYFPVAFA